MRVCSHCKTTYSDKVDFCFKDGVSLINQDASATMPISREAGLTSSQSSTEVFGMANDDAPTDAFALPAQQTQGGLPSVEDMLQFSTRSRRRRRRGRPRNTLDEVSSQTIVPNVGNEELEEAQILENTSFFKKTDLEVDSESFDEASDSTDMTEPHIISNSSSSVSLKNEPAPNQDNATSPDMDVISSEHHLENELEEKVEPVVQPPKVESPISEPSLDRVNSNVPEPTFDEPIMVQQSSPSWGLLIAGLGLLALVGFGVVGLFENGPESTPVAKSVEPSDEAIRSVVAPGVPIVDKKVDVVETQPIEAPPPAEEPEEIVANQEVVVPVAETEANSEPEPIPVPVPVPPVVNNPAQEPAQNEPPPPVTVTPPQPISQPPPAEPEPVASSQATEAPSNQAQLQWGSEAEPEASGPTELRIQANVSGVVVYVNGERKGNAPLTVSIPQNQVAEIKAEKEGYSEQQKRIIPSGPTADVNFSLERINTVPLQKVMLIAPVGVNVTISGETHNIPGFTSLPVGIHTASWTTSEGESKQKTFTVSNNDGGTQRISLD